IRGSLSLLIWEFILKYLRTILSTTTPQPFLGYPSPTTTTFYPTVQTSLPGAVPKVPAKLKLVNVFSNDGSFLERFQRNKKQEEDKRKVEEALARQVLIAFVILLGLHHPARKVKVDGASL
ncbi:hypothetical protein AZE42_06888, partial [Rhizopogon vesiculosus]